MADATCLPIANHNMGALFQNGLNECDNIGTAVLIIAIGIDNNIGIEFEASVKTRFECMTQTAIFWKSDNMIHTEIARDLRRAIRRTIVNDQNLDFVNTGNFARNIVNRSGQGFFFVETGNLDNQFHF